MKKQFTVEGIEERNPNKFGGMCSRAIAVKSKNFKEGIDTIATTDQPALVVDWDRWEIVREILPMDYVEMPANDKVPLLDSHMRGGVDKIKGSAMNWTKNGSQLLCKTFVSESETVVRQKIEEGHIDSVSIGYRTESDMTVEVPKGKAIKIDGKEYRNAFEDGIPMLVRTWWMPHELSLVPIGADDAAKFKSNPYEQKALIDKIAELERKIDEGLGIKEVTKEQVKEQEKEEAVNILKLIHERNKRQQLNF